MDFKIEILPRGDYVEFIISGKAIYSEADVFYRQIIEHITKYLSVAKFLINVEFLNDRYGPTKAIDWAGTIPVSIKNLKFAVLEDKNNRSIHSFRENIFFNRGLRNIKYFSEKKEAVKWLLATQLPS